MSAASPTDLFVDAIAGEVVRRLENVIASKTTERRLLDVRQAAEYLGFTAHAIRHKKTSGELPWVRIGERGVRFDIKDLDRWIEERKG